MHKPSLILAAKYLAVIMVISLFFSVNIYNASMQEIGRGYRRFGAGINRSLNQQELSQFRDEQLALSRQALLNQLVLINSGIILIGGAISYYLARRTLKPIEDAHDAQNRFTSDASHELRTPITAMRTEIETFMMSSKPRLSDAKAVMRSNIEEIDKITELIDGLLRLARSKDANPVLDYVTIEELIDLGVSKVQNYADDKQITIKRQLNDDSTLALVDSELMSDAIKMLLENAIKFSEPSKTVAIKAYLKNDKLTISIIDHGPGIKQSQLPYIFDRFYQGEASRSKLSKPGFGIGLSIVKSIIQLHDGDISVKSQPRAGATFTITIPQRKNSYSRFSNHL